MAPLVLDVAGRILDRGQCQSSILDNLVCDLVEAVHQPEVCGFAGAVVGLGHTLDATLLLKLLDLLVIVARFEVVDTECLAAGLVEDAEHRNIAGTVCDIDHVAQRYPPLRLGHTGIDVNGRIDVDTLVDLEQRPGLGCVSDVVREILDLTTLAGHRQLIEKPRRCGLLDEAVGPDPIDMRRDSGSLDHRTQTGRHDEVFDGDVFLGKVLRLSDAAARLLEELGDAGAEFELGAKLLQLGVVETLEDALLHIAEDVNEIGQATADDLIVGPVVFDEPFDFTPESGLVDVVLLERLAIAYCPGSACDRSPK